MTYISREKIETAADKLEALTAVMKNIIQEMRNGDEENPDAAIYWLRRQIGYELNRLGEVPSCRNVKTVGERYADWV